MATRAHQAAGCPDDRRLAQYVDGVLTGAELSAMQRHLVTCVTCRDIVADAVGLLKKPQPKPSVQWSLAWHGALAAAATLVIAVAATMAVRLLRPHSDRPELSELVAAVAGQATRPVEGLLVELPYAAPPSTLRSPSQATVPPAVVQAAATLVRAAEAADTPENRAAAGVADLVLGELDAAVDALENAAGRRPNDARVLSDLAAAYAARARMLGRSTDWPRALAAAERSLAIAPQLPEAHFNLALALEGLLRDADAAAAWASFRRLTGSTPARSEAAEREEEARRRAVR